jgi:hypothetical protein
MGCYRQDVDLTWVIVLTCLSTSLPSPSVETPAFIRLQAFTQGYHLWGGVFNYMGNHFLFFKMMNDLGEADTRVSFQDYLGDVEVEI